MPIYEYFCPDCSIKFEKLVSLGRSEEQHRCPGCDGENTRKLLSTFAALRSSGDGSGESSYMGSGSSGGCAGCSGGSCASCH